MHVKVLVRSCVLEDDYFTIVCILARSGHVLIADYRTLEIQVFLNSQDLYITWDLIPVI